ncbi:MAG: NUDIX hydrolase [Xanthomonadales bacterium]|nr:NUDIX hydrolase [Xanthomonadales bacterium]
MTTLHQGKFLGLRDRDGWEYCFRTNAHAVVAVIAVTADRELLFTEQYRPPVQCRVIEFPAGLVGDDGVGEDPATAGQRELLEETGYRADQLQLLTLGPTSAGLTDEVIHFFLAENAHQVTDGGGVGGEEIQVHRVPLAEVHDWLRRCQANGLMLDPKVYAGLYFLQQRA